MANRIKGLTVEIDGSTTGLDKALKNVNTPIKGTQTQLKDVQKLLKLDPSNTELLSQKQRLLKEAIGATKDKLDSLKTAQEQAKKQLEGVEGIMNLAAASGEDLGTTSDIVTDALTAFGLSAKDSGHFADILAAASTNANTNVSMLGESFKYAAPVAGSLGINAEDTSVALGLMANAGIKASQADTPEPYDGQKNYIDEFLQPLSPDDPRYGESLYRAQGNLNYHFGMNISADFIMTNGGNDDRGNPVTFEFNGDDDMWVFVDGVLLLDMGGCHHAHSGSINFETGEIVVQNLRTQNTTTIKECYRNAHVYPDGTPWPVGDDSLVDKYFHNDTYVDYGAHNLQMYYMERGGGASNLHVKFNLTIAEPGKLKISKSLKDVDPRYAKENFWYQICDAAGNPITHIGAGNDDITSIVNEKTGQAISIDSNGRFSLKAGETAVVSVRESHIHYSVREIGLNPNDYDVLINGEQTPVLNGTAATESDTVDNRPLVVFENSPKHLGSLRITKFVDSVVKVETSPKFEFYVYLDNRIVLTVQQGTITAVMENPGTTLYADQLPDNHKAFRFEVMNHPGVELPNTGGNGTDLIYRVGLLMTAIAIAGLLLRSRIRGIS